MKRGGALALATLCLLAQLSSLAHVAAVSHVTCAEHGEQVHATPQTSPHAANSVHTTTESATDGHDHCAIAALRTTPATVSAATTSITTVSSPALPVAGGLFPVTQVALFRLAPKTSPPSALA
jgi:hypothetical protein